MASRSTINKCDIKNCPFTLPTPVLTCCAKDCDRKCHIACFQKLVLERYGLTAVDGPEGEELVACTKKHSLAVARESCIPINDQNIRWDRDGKEGPQDPNHSEATIIEWLQTKDNNENYRNGDRGKTKQQHAAEIAAIIKDRGCIKVSDSAGAIAPLNVYLTFNHPFLKLGENS